MREEQSFFLSLHICTLLSSTGLGIRVILSSLELYSFVRTRAARWLQHSWTGRRGVARAGGLWPVPLWLASTLASAVRAHSNPMASSL